MTPMTLMMSMIALALKLASQQLYLLVALYRT